MWSCSERRSPRWRAATISPALLKAKVGSDLNLTIIVKFATTLYILKHTSGLTKYWKEGGVYIGQPRTVEELTKTVFSIKVDETPPPISSLVYPPYSQVKKNTCIICIITTYIALLEFRTLTIIASSSDKIPGCYGAREIFSSQSGLPPDSGDGHLSLDLAPPLGCHLTILGHLSYSCW